MTTASLLLTVAAIPDREHVRVVAAGEIDLSSVELLRDELEALFAVGWRDVIVDLREVSFMDTSGVHALIVARRRAHDLGGDIAVVCDGGAVHRLLELTMIEHSTVAV
jgi:anti-anti-sigma factor